MDQDEALILTLYSREYCHLCHEMRAQIEAMMERFAFDLQILDVDSDAALEDRYGELVPVLTHGERELARYRLQPGGLEAFFLHWDAAKTGGRSR